MPEIAEFVRVATRIATGGAVRRRFGLGMLVTADPDLGAAGAYKSRLATTAAGLADAVSDGPARRNAQVWFAADPAPQGLHLMRWAHQDVATRLIGTAPAPVASIALANAAFAVGGTTVTVNLTQHTTLLGTARTGNSPSATLIGTSRTFGVFGENITIDTSGLTTREEIAAAVQAGLRGATDARLALASFIWNEDARRFEFRIPSNETITQWTAGSGGTSITTALGMNSPTSSTGVAMTYAEIAAAVEDALRGSGGALAGATFAFEDGVFRLALAGPDDIGPAFTAPATGTDISALLGMAAGADYRPGHRAETLTDALDEAIANVADAPTFLLLADDVPAEVGGANTAETLMAYCEARDIMCGIDDEAEAATLAAGESQVQHAFANQYSHTVAVFAAEDQRPAVGALAQLSAVNYDGLASTITLHGKAVPGAQPAALSADGYRNLVARRGNALTTIGGLPTFVEGFTSRAGHWADSVAWLLWMQSRIETEIWDALRGSRRLTTAALFDRLDQAMQQGVRNGGLQPGRTLSGVSRQDVITTTGNREFDGTLTTGYLIHVGPLSAQSQTDRDSRLAPPIKIWAVGSEAIHRANIDLVFVN